MKRIYFVVFIAIVGFGLGSCKKDKVVKPAPLIKNDISGNWMLLSSTDEYIFGSKSILTFNHPFPADTLDHITFKTDGTGVLVKNKVAFARFKYDATDSVVHFTDVQDNETNDLLGNGAYVRYITKLDATNMELVTRFFPLGPHYYGNDRYDMVLTHLLLKKE